MTVEKLLNLWLRSQGVLQPKLQSESDQNEIVAMWVACLAGVSAEALAQAIRLYMENNPEPFGNPAALLRYCPGHWTIEEKAAAAWVQVEDESDRYLDEVTFSDPVVASALRMCGVRRLEWIGELNEFERGRLRSDFLLFYRRCFVDGIGDAKPFPAERGCSGTHVVRAAYPVTCEHSQQGQAGYIEAIVSPGSLVRTPSGTGQLEYQPA